MNIRKYAAEFVGTALLVIFGCGTAMLVGCSKEDSGYLLTALAFGLAIVPLAYSIGNVSGCHINPAVSLGLLFCGGIGIRNFLFYIIAQFLGGIAGAFALMGIFTLGGLEDATEAFGANGLTGVNGSFAAGLLVECILTFVFVLAVIGVKDKKAGHGSFGGLVVALTLTLVHILGIGLTGTSVNPARSLGPAVVAAVTGNTEPLLEVWVFIVGPLVGALLAAVFYRLVRRRV